VFKGLTTSTIHGLRIHSTEHIQ